MYDFYFADRESICARPEDFLIFCKRLLPRWANGIPDSECIALWRILKSLPKQAPTLVETGSGASSLALFLHAALNGGKVFSWDTNASKGAYLRSVISDAMCRVLEVDIHKIWTFIPFNSTDPHVGISALKEMGLTADFGFFDSWHVLDHLLQEIDHFEKVASPKFVIALDDAYYTMKYQNFAYVNMIRQKLGLRRVDEPQDNRCKPFYEEVDSHLRGRYPVVEKIQDEYKQLYAKDLSLAYYESNREFTNLVGMEDGSKLDHRFDAWRVS